MRKKLNAHTIIVSLSILIIGSGILVHLHNESQSLRRAQSMVSFEKVVHSIDVNIPAETISAYRNTLEFKEMLAILEDERPLCHSEAHNIGKAIYAETTDIRTALDICERTCNDGCFHGMIMGIFQTLTENASHTHASNTEHSDSHIVLTDDNKASVTNLLLSICSRDDVLSLTKGKQGDCMHALGHAVLFLANYNIEEALNLCRVFENDGFEYYCATGVYMERNLAVTSADNNQDPLEPCRAHTNFPSACFRYEIQELHDTNLLTYADVKHMCEALDERHLRIGCFHGLGFGYHSLVLQNPEALLDLCDAEDKTAMRLCIEGAVGVMESNHLGSSKPACALLPETMQSVCADAADVRDFGMDRDFSLYHITNDRENI